MTRTSGDSANRPLVELVWLLDDDGPRAWVRGA